MEIENVSRVSFATRRATQQQGELTISNSLLGEIIINNQSVLAAIAEELAHGNTSIWGDELHWRRLGSRSRNDNGIIHGASLLQLVDNLCHRRALLADGDIDADHVLTFLIDDGVDRNRGLAGLTVTNDQFTLATTDRNHRVDRFETGLHRLVNRFTFHDTRRLDFNLAVGVRFNRTLTINRNTDTVNDATNQRFADRNLNDSFRSLDCVAFLDVLGITEDRSTNVVFLEIENHSHGVSRELQQLASHRLVQAMDTGDTVTRGDNGSCFANLDFTPEVFDLFLDNCADFFCFNLHYCDLITLFVKDSSRILRFV